MRAFAAALRGAPHRSRVASQNWVASRNRESIDDRRFTVGLMVHTLVIGGLLCALLFCN